MYIKTPRPLEPSLPLSQSNILGFNHNRTHTCSMCVERSRLFTFIPYSVFVYLRGRDDFCATPQTPGVQPGPGAFTSKH